MLIIFIYRQVPVKRRYRKSNFRAKSYEYYLNGMRVCSHIFHTTLGVSKSRVEYVLRKRTKEGATLLDSRGKRTPGNKTSTEKVEKMQSFLNRIPKYQSRNNASKFLLSAELNYSKLLDMYCIENPENKISHSIFKREFYM